jgi:hypothetical protein
MLHVLPDFERKKEWNESKRVRYLKEEHIDRKARKGRRKV